MISTTQEPTTAEDGFDPFPTTDVRPGENGIATQEEEEAPPTYEPKEPTQQELGIAQEILDELENRRGMSPEAVVSALIRIVDVHAKFTTVPDLFENTDEIYAPASVVGEIARLLCRCPKIEVPYLKVGFWFKDHEKWTSAGQTVDAQVKRYDGFHQYVNEGMLAAIIVNYHHWRTLNPRQKVFSVYHALRELDQDGKRIAPDFVGYYEEPGLFGAGVHREMVTMARAFVKDAPERAGEPYQLSILDEVYDEEE